MSLVHNSKITYGNSNNNCGNTTTSFNQCNISIPDEKRKILDWISPFASRERHQAVRDSRVEKVGDWLFCNENFSTWRTSEDRTAKPVLFCYGHPGAGKTYISSLVIDTLLKWIDGDGVAVAYVYCDFTTRTMQSTNAVLGSVLRQVVGALEKIPDEVQQEFERANKQTDGCGLRLPEILDMLTKFLPSLNRAFICIDALDEFPTKQRAQLWKSLQRVVWECPNTRLFLTGRPQIRTEAEGYFPGEAGMVPIEPTEEDIRRYIEERFEGDLEKSTIDEGLRADIRRVVPKRVSGIFLLVCLGMDEILAATTIRQKRQALDRMANGLGVQDAYSTTLDRIRQQDGEKSKLGMAVLIWASRSERPLQWKELSHPLGVDLVAGEFTIDNVPSVRTVLGCTLGLVTIDENASTVRLLHLTLQEYLGASPTVFETPQSMMAETCLTYLNSLSFQAPQGNSNKALNTVLAESPFLEYATRFWGTHADREMTVEVKSLALQLLDGYESHVSATILLREKRWGWWSGEDVSGISGLHCIAFSGIVEIAIAMLEAKKWDVNGRDSKGDTPLMWAVRYGNDRVVELLLEQGDIRPDEVIRDGRTVLSFVAESGNEGAVRLLLGHGDVGPDFSDSSGRTPLSFAASGGQEVVVKLLLEHKEVNPNSSDKNGRTPLLFAVQGRHEDVTKLLLERGDVNPNSWDSSGRTSLSFAAEEGCETVAKLLLEREDVNPDKPGNDGRTPLSFAAGGGCEVVVRLLLGRQDVNPNSLNSDGQPPLSYAAAGRHGSVLKLLVESSDIDPNSSDSYGLTPLLYAAKWGREDLVKRFLEHGGVNPGQPDSNGRTPLSFAAEGGHEGVVRLLLGYEEVDPDSQDLRGRTSLSLAAEGGHEDVVKLLLECHGVNPNSPDSSGRTPLSFAALRGGEGVVRLLLDRGEVNSNLSDSYGLSPLSYAAFRGHEGVVKLLQEQGGISPD